MDYTVHGILQARILEWVASGSSQPRDQTQVSCIAGRFFTIWATKEAQQQDRMATKQPMQTQSQSWNTGEVVEGTVGEGGLE